MWGSLSSLGSSSAGWALGAAKAHAGGRGGAGGRLVVRGAGMGSRGALGCVGLSAYTKAPQTLIVCCRFRPRAHH